MSTIEPRAPLATAMRQPPHAIAAEQALLGALLANNSAYDRVGAFLRPEHFVDAAHARIYEAISKRVEGGRLADAVTLAVDLAEDPLLAEAGGTKYLGQLLAAMVGIINAGDYGRKIRDAWLARELIAAGEDLVNGCFSPGDRPISEILDEHEVRLLSIAETGAADREVSSPAHDAMGTAIAQAVEARDRPSGLIGISTGYRELDDITAGLRGGLFYLLGARPSMGKTTLGLGIAAGAARAGSRVLFVSAEMTRAAIGAQLVAGLADVPRDAAERGATRRRDDLGRFAWDKINQGCVDRMVAAQKAMSSRTLTIDECPSRTVAAVRMAARRMKRRGGLDLVVVDYLQLLRVPELARIGNRVLEVSRLSADLKSLAKELGVPVLVLSQLNRGLESREDKRPGLSDLRDSGSLEQDADVVAFLHREEYFLLRNVPARRPNETEDQFLGRTEQWQAALEKNRGVGEVIFQKQRLGVTGTRLLHFDDSRVWFTDRMEADNNDVP